MCTIIILYIRYWRAIVYYILHIFFVNSFRSQPAAISYTQYNGVGCRVTSSLRMENKSMTSQRVMATAVNYNILSFNVP